MVSSMMFPDAKRNHERGERREDKVTSAEGERRRGERGKKRGQSDKC